MAKFNHTKQRREQQKAARAERALERREARELARAVRRGATKMRSIARASAGPRIRRSAGHGRAGRPSGATPAVLMKIHRGGRGGDQYAREKDGSELIDANVSADPARRDRAWDRDQAAHPQVKDVLVHLSFSRPAGQPLSDQQWREFLEKWKDKTGFNGCKFIAWRHSDSQHDHIHLIVSRHRPGGELVSNSWNFLRWRQAVREAESEMGLSATPRESDNPAPSDRAVSARRRADRRGSTDPWINPADVRAALSHSQTAERFQRELSQRGIELQVKKDSAGKPVGLLMRRTGAEEWLAGSSINREFSLSRVGAQLQQNASAQRQRDFAVPSPHVLQQMQQQAPEPPREYPRERPS